MKNIKGKITGITFFKISEETWEKLQGGVLLTLKRDIDNQYDKHAVQILYQRQQIGWVDKQDNEEISRILDEGAIVTTKIIRTFSTLSDRPHLEVIYIYEKK